MDLEKRVRQLEAEKANLIWRNRLLRDRPDVPMERLCAYEKIMQAVCPRCGVKVFDDEGV